MYYNLFERVILPAELRALQRQFEDGTITAEEMRKEQQGLMDIYNESNKT